MAILDVDHTLPVQSPISRNTADTGTVGSGNLAMRGERSALPLSVDIVLLKTNLAQSSAVDIDLTPVDLNMAFSRKLNVSNIALLTENRISSLETVRNGDVDLAGLCELVQGVVGQTLIADICGGMV